MNDIIKKHEQEFVNILDHLKNEIKSLKTGRATPAMVENIQIEAYGVKTPLNHRGSRKKSSRLLKRRSKGTTIIVLFHFC